MEGTETYLNFTVTSGAYNRYLLSSTCQKSQHVHIFSFILLSSQLVTSDAERR